MYIICNQAYVTCDPIKLGLLFSRLCLLLEANPDHVFFLLVCHVNVETVQAIHGLVQT